MKYTVRFLDTVDLDITTIIAYLEEQLVPPNLVLSPLFDQIEKDLPHSPFMYPEYLEDQRFRKMAFKRYLVFYLIDKERGLVEVHHILHEKQNIRKLFKA